MAPNKTKIRRPVALVILDGWGYSPRTDGNAIAIAHTPYYDEICRKYPMTTLATGFEDGQPVGSETGHLITGTGRRAQTEVSRMRNDRESGEFMRNPVLSRAFSKAKADGSAVHLIGLLSDGGAHSSPENLFALLRMAKLSGLKDVFIHCILDGLDVPARTADIYIEALEVKQADIGVGRIATLCGRHFAMDSEENWERTARVFTMLVHGEGERANDAVTAVRNSFLRGIADEFIAPIVLESAPDMPVTRISGGDLVVLFNHRADAMRQLARSLSVAEGTSGAKPNIETVCLTEYDAAFNLPVAFRREPERNTLSTILSAFDVPQTRISEAGRIRHLTHFFDGCEDLAPVEQQVIVAGSSNGRGDPESQSFKITDQTRRALASSAGAVIVNIPAAALMAETGDLGKTVAAVQFIDTCIGGICEKASAIGGVVMLTSTSGNAEQMIDPETGERDSLTTANPVPFHYIDDTAGERVTLHDGKSLEDIAPTILAVLDIEKPSEMTGSDIRSI